MVKLPEYRGKEVFRRYGVPLPKGQVVRSAAEADSVLRAGTVPLPCVVKAQVLAGGRGKGGAVRFANTAGEGREATQAILGLEFKGEHVREVLLEEKLTLSRELYLSLTLDRSRRLPLLMASPAGGVEIESVPDDKILKIWIHPHTGLVSYQKRKVAKFLGVSPPVAKSLDALLESLWRIFLQEDAELVEINPLAIVGDGVVALDSKVIVEDDAMFRHPEYDEVHGDLTPLEEKAHAKGIAFVEIGGDIGVIANGAGLTMATLDVLSQEGGKPGIFLDLGGTDDPKKVAEAFLLMAQAHPKVVFINVFGGVTRCDTVANGLVEALKLSPPTFPLVARIRGNNEKEGVAILRGAGVGSYTDLAEAARNVVALEQGKARAAPPRAPGANEGAVVAGASGGSP
jgi:succinyl-CoA synthetase beta subunit